MKTLLQILGLCTLQAWAAVSCGGTIFQDDFESGKTGSYWTDLTYVSVEALPALTGRAGYAMKFRFVGNADDTKDAMSEARFDLGKEYKDINISFDLYIPTNYYHSKPSDRADNNKFFRLWRVQYSEGDQVGASTISALNGLSGIGADYKQQPGWGVSTALWANQDFITAADLGKWMSIKINAVAPINDVNRGTIEIWKNGTLLLRSREVADSEPGEQGWRYGYLMGWANSGFREDTNLYIDNVKFWVDEARPKAVEGTVDVR